MGIQPACPPRRVCPEPGGAPKGRGAVTGPDVGACPDASTNPSLRQDGAARDITVGRPFRQERNGVVHRRKLCRLGPRPSRGKRLGFPTLSRESLRLKYKVRAAAERGHRAGRSATSAGAAATSDTAAGSNCLHPRRLQDAHTSSMPSSPRDTWSRRCRRRHSHEPRHRSRMRVRQHRLLTFRVACRRSALRQSSGSPDLRPRHSPGRAGRPRTRPWCPWLDRRTQPKRRR